jgi:hypothetical protein
MNRSRWAPDAHTTAYAGPETPAALQSAHPFLGEPGAKHTRLVEEGPILAGSMMG